MGEPMDRVTRPSAQPGRLLWAGAAIAAVAVVALVMMVGDIADNDEILATLMLAPVCIAALFGGRRVGLAMAAVAALAYAGLRLGDVDDVGAGGAAVLLMSRAVVFVAAAWFTPTVAARLPGPEAGGRAAPRHRAGAHAYPPGPADVEVPPAGAGLADLGGPPRPVPASFAAHDPPEPVAAPGADTQGGWGPDDDWGVPEEGEPAAYAVDADDGDEWDLSPLTPPAPSWEEPLSPVEAWDESPANGNGRPWVEEPGPAPAPTWDEPPAAPTPSPAPAPAPTGGGWDQPVGPAAPNLPTGWVDDATNPPGDETIPVGYTGELFLPPDLGLEPPEVGSGMAAGNGWTGRPVAPPSSPPIGSPPAPVPPRVEPSAPSRDSVFVGGSPPEHPHTQDPETRLWNARFFRERLTVEVEAARRSRTSFSVVLVQVPDEPFRHLPYRRQVALLRELGHQFVQARMVDHLVHLPDGDKHWFAVILAGAARPEAQDFETRLRSAIGGYLRHRGLQIHDLQSASMTSPDDDEVMADVWASLLGSSVPSEPTY